ncbi:hypothetical protein AALA22_03415 [Anaerovoracaceae bacterium 41-7]
MKKVISMLLALTLVLGMGTAAFAESEPVLETGVVENPVVLDFRDYSYTFDTLSEEDVNVVKTEDSLDAIEYRIYHKKDQAVIDTVRVDFEQPGISTYATNANDTRSTFFSKYKTIKNTKTNKAVVELQYKVRVDFYESGSFRSFYGADSPNLLIRSAITDCELVNVEKGVKSATGKYPTTSLTYNYSANVRTTESVSATSSAELLGAGFSVTTGTNKYYYRIVSETGTIDLY